MLNVFDEIDTEYELAAYRLKLLALADRFAAGERTSVGGGSAALRGRPYLPVRRSAAGEAGEGRSPNGSI